LGIQKTFLNEEKEAFLKVPTYQSPICQKFLNCQIIQSTTRGLLYNPNNYYPIKFIQNRKKYSTNYPKLQLLGIQILLYLSLTFTRLFVENFKMNQDDLIDFEGFSESGKGSDTRGL
jgi:hypothetical protein